MDLRHNHWHLCLQLILKSSLVNLHDPHLLLRQLHLLPILCHSVGTLTALRITMLNMRKHVLQRLSRNTTPSMPTTQIHSRPLYICFPHMHRNSITREGLMIRIIFICIGFLIGKIKFNSSRKRRKPALLSQLFSASLPNTQSLLSMWTLATLSAER